MELNNNISTTTTLDTNFNRPNGIDSNVTHFRARTPSPSSTSSLVDLPPPLSPLLPSNVVLEVLGVVENFVDLNPLPSPSNPPPLLTLPPPSNPPPLERLQRSLYNLYNLFPDDD